MRYLLLIVTLIANFVSAEAQSWTFSNKLSGDNDVTGIKSDIYIDNTIVTLGNFQGTINTASGESLDSYGGRDYYVLKTDELGQVSWLRQIGSIGNEYFGGGVATDSDGNVFVTGGFRNYLKYTDVDSVQSSGAFDIFLLKYDPDGTVLYCNVLGSGSKNQRPNALSIDDNNNIYLSGFYSDSISFGGQTTLYSTNSFDNYFYSKINNADGSIQWVRNVEAINHSFSGRIFEILTGPDYVLMTGSFNDSIAFETDTIVSENSSQDVHLIKSDIDGNINWIRKVQGNGWLYSYSLSTDESHNIFLSGYFDSPSITIDSTESSSIVIEGNKGSSDLFICKYSVEGELQWANSFGGKGEDKIVDTKYYNGLVNISGQFADSLLWGGNLLNTKGINDIDMFIGSVDTDGNFRSANSFSGKDNSTEEGRSLFYSEENLYTIIRSNSSLLELGDSIYASSSGKYYIALGIVGCLPISIDNVDQIDITTCHGDSTGTIQISVSGGFGAPWNYSIDNNETSKNLPLFLTLPAGDYQIVVTDAEGCSEVYPSLTTINQPDSLVVNIDSYKDIALDEDGWIVASGSGGTSPYTFTLMPDSLFQGSIGTFTFAPGDSGVYTIEMNDSRGCGPVESETIKIRDFSHVGFEELSGIVMKVFPNPASDVITVEMPMEAAEVSLELLNLTGQVMKSRQAYTSGGVLRETIDVSDLARGMYMLRVNGEILKTGVVVN